MTTLHYFAADGNYGSADQLVIVDTSDWDVDEWDIIDQTPDSDRAMVAFQMSQGKGQIIDPTQDPLPGI